MDVNEFDEDEERAYMEVILNQKKLEDDNLEVFLIEAQEVIGVEDNQEIDNILTREMGADSDCEDDDLVLP